jgi:F-type H+-transporting ATPase subunit b
MADAATTSSTAAHAGGGLPQFDLAQWPGQILWLLVIFAILYVLFAKVFVPRVGGTIDAREDRISGDIGDARRMKEEAEAAAADADREMVEARARAHKVADDAKAEAKAAAALRQAQEDAKLAEILGAAEARIAEARGEAMGHVRGIALETAGAIIGKLTGVPATSREIEQAMAGEGAA